MSTVDTFPNPGVGDAPAPGGIWYTTFGELGQIEAATDEVEAGCPLRHGKVVRQTDYFASPFEAPDWRQPFRDPRS